jgi:hypothetical protein
MYAQESGRYGAAIGWPAHVASKQQLREFYDNYNPYLLQTSVKEYLLE